MKKVLIALGSVFVGLILMVGVMLGAGYWYLQAHETEASTYVETVIRQVATGWSDTALMGEASPEMLRVASGPQVRALFRTLGERLGGLRRYDGATREAYTVNFTMEGRVLTLTHAARALFDNGPATIRVRTIHRAGQWKVLDFFVQSEALLDDSPHDEHSERVMTRL